MKKFFQENVAANKNLPREEKIMCAILLSMLSKPEVSKSYMSIFHSVDHVIMLEMCEFKSAFKRVVDEDLLIVTQNEGTNLYSLPKEYVEISTEDWGLMLSKVKGH